MRLRSIRDLCRLFLWNRVERGDCVIKETFLKLRKLYVYLLVLNLIMQWFASLPSMTDENEMVKMRVKMRGKKKGVEKGRVEKKVNLCVGG